MIVILRDQMIIFSRVPGIYFFLIFHLLIFRFRVMSLKRRQYSTTTNIYDIDIVGVIANRIMKFILDKYQKYLNL